MFSGRPDFLRFRVYRFAAGMACLAALTMAPSPARAAGTTALEFLKLGVGARAAGMGDAFVSVADDASASYWNPAGLSGREGQEVLFNHMEWFQDVRHENASYVWGNDVQGFGVSATILHVSDLQERDASGNYLGEFRFFDNAIGVSYSRQVMSALRLGVTGKYLREQIDRESAQTVAFDGGALYDIQDTGFTLGASIANLGPGLKFIEESDDLPMTFTVGGSYRVPSMFSYVGGSTVALDVRKTKDADTSVRFGAEIGVAGIAKYRIGWSGGLDGQDFGTGFGVNFDRYRLDYAFVPSSFELGDTHRFSFALGF